jgi:hypothetical protein
MNRLRSYALALASAGLVAALAGCDSGGPEAVPGGGPSAVPSASPGAANSGAAPEASAPARPKGKTRSSPGPLPPPDM